MPGSLSMNPTDGERMFMYMRPMGYERGRGTGRWSPLPDREREALYQKFVGKLPREYRELLKDYYQALSK